MPPRPSTTLTPAELRLMRVFWDRGECTVADLVAAIEENLAYTSVLTTVRILETKGYLTHRQQGRAFLYTASVMENETSRSELRHLMHRFFGDSRERLLLSLLGEAEADPEELRRLREMVANAPEDTPEPQPGGAARERKGKAKR